ncbi:MAG TPA: nucleotidyltransferase substrate binding protein [Methylobacter sp.]
MQDIRWQQRFDNLQSAYQRLQHAVQANTQTPNNELYQMALIKAFEMTFELSWKTMKDYLKYNGIDVKLPREVIKQAFANDIITDGQLWIDMLEAHNLMAHTYDEVRALDAANRICRHYMMGLEQLYRYLLARLP